MSGIEHSLTHSLTRTQIVEDGEWKVKSKKLSPDWRSQDPKARHFTFALWPLNLPPVEDDDGDFVRHIEHIGNRSKAAIAAH